MPRFLVQSFRVLFFKFVQREGIVVKDELHSDKSFKIQNGRDSEKKISNESGNPQKYDFKFLFIVFLMSILTIMLIYGSVVFFVKNTAKAPEQCVNCHEHSMLDYEVNLKQDQDSLPPVLESRMSYLSALIDTITLKCNYNLAYDRNLEHNCACKIFAEMRIVDKDAPEGSDNVLYAYDDELYSSEEKSEYSSFVEIAQNIVVPYSKYNEIAARFAEQNDIEPDAFVNIKFIVMTSGKSENVESLERTSTTLLKIPLYEKIIDIDESFAQSENDFTFDAYIPNVRNISLGLICACFALVMFAMEWVLINSRTSKQKNKPGRK